MDTSPSFSTSLSSSLFSFPSSPPCQRATPRLPPCCLHLYLVSIRASEAAALFWHVGWRALAVPSLNPLRIAALLLGWSDTPMPLPYTPSPPSTGSGEDDIRWEET